MTVEVLHKFPEGEARVAEWDEAVERMGAPVYMTIDWLTTWWEHYGRGTQLQLFVARDPDGTIAGLLPLYVQRVGFWPLSIRVARLVGANLPPKAFDPALSETGAYEVLGSVLRRLLLEGGADVLSFGSVSEMWSGFRSMERVCAGARGLGLRGHRVSRGHRTVFALPGTNEQYYERMDAGERKSRLKRIRQLERRHSVHVDVIDDPESVVEEFERFAVLHAHQWRAVGKGGHFEAWPRALEYNRALVARCAAHGRVRFYRMLVDDQVVASRYTFRLGDRVYSELPARLIGEPWDKRGVGVSSLIKFVEQCIGEGISVIDSGLGAYEHKVSVGGQEVRVHLWRYWNPAILRRLKTFGWMGLSRCVLAVYQKLYYRRILPRLPATFSRSQPIGWLKHDY